MFSCVLPQKLITVIQKYKANMIVKQIIKADPKRKRLAPANGEHTLKVSEFFFNSIQGEGINIGCPSAFLRLRGCPLNCSWCDTTEVWRYGNSYTFGELVDLMNRSGLTKALRNGQHLVITGGSPLLQQEALTGFLLYYIQQEEFTLYVEIENECHYAPNAVLERLVSCWNNSPKLSSSGVRQSVRYRPDVIKLLSSYSNSWFKFVVGCEDDWKEILMDFLEPQLISREQIILMPMGATRVELEKNREMVLNLAIEHNVRYCTREHIIIWDKKTGV